MKLSCMSASTWAVLGLATGASAFLAPAARPLRTPAASRRATSVVMSKEGVSFGDLDGTASRVGIIKTRWNGEIVDRLYDGVKTALKECNVTDDNIFVTEVPGAFELPLAARFLALSQTVDAVVCLGCLIKGDTMHFEYIADAASKGIMDVALSTSTPIVFGVLTVLDEEQATKRSTEDGNEGVGWGKTAVEMALLRASALGQGKPASLGFGKASAMDGEKKGAVPGKKIGF